MRMTYCLMAFLCLGTAGDADDHEVSRLARFLQDADPGKCADAAEALGKLGPAAAPALPQLVQSLGDERETPRTTNSSMGFPYSLPVSSVARDALLAIGEPAIPPLIEELKRKRRPTRSQIVDLLATIGTPAQAALPELAAIVHSTTRNSLRQSAVSAYLLIADNSLDVLDHLILWVDDRDEHIRYFAMESMGSFGSKAAAAVPTLTKHLTDDSEVRVMISDHLGFETPLRQFACEALGKIGAPSHDALPQLQQMMHHDSQSVVRVAAALAFSRIDLNREDGVRVLITELQRSPEGLNSVPQAAEALGELGPRAVPAWSLLEPLSRNEKFEWNRSTALRALSKIDGPRSLKRLTAALENDPNTLVRETAAECIGNLGETASPAIPALIRSLEPLDDDDFKISLRAASAKSLGQIGPLAIEALPTLEKLRTTGSSDWEKDAAAEAIRLIKP